MASCGEQTAGTPPLRAGIRAHPEPTWPRVTAGLESRCEARRDDTSHSHSSPEGNHAGAGQGQLEDIMGARTREVRGGQERWLQKGTQGQTGSGHSRFVSC